ncbi:MAG: S49 family peptidase [Chthoniobacteraceae bacterium]|nr:S49 family peptidase [Chthoniobacteraceae bacterium]
MNLPHILQAVYTAPWAITREGWSAVHAIVKQHAAGQPVPKLDADPDQDFFGNPMPKMQVTDAGVAIIPICGTLMNHAGLLEKMCGACSYDDIRHDLDTALGVRALQKIVLHIDSPGGTCNGSQEIADKIARIRESGVRIEAVTDSQICSAAYNLAAGCNSISATRTSVIGSIGVIIAMLDESLAYEMQGYTRDLITSGPLKGTGYPGTSLSSEQRAYLQGTVDAYFKMFRAHVLNYRPTNDESMQGQVFIGEQAYDAGLVDELIEDVGTVLSADCEDDLGAE